MSGLASRSLHKTFSSDVGYVRYARGFACLNHINEDGENSQQTHYFHYDRNRHSKRDNRLRRQSDLVRQLHRLEVV